MKACPLNFVNAHPTSCAEALLLAFRASPTLSCHPCPRPPSSSDSMTTSSSSLSAANASPASLSASNASNRACVAYSTGSIQQHQRNLVIKSSSPRWKLAVELVTCVCWQAGDLLLLAMYTWKHAVTLHSCVLASVNPAWVYLHARRVVHHCHRLRHLACAQRSPPICSGQAVTQLIVLHIDKVKRTSRVYACQHALPFWNMLMLEYQTRRAQERACPRCCWSVLTQEQLCGNLSACRLVLAWFVGFAPGCGHKSSTAMMVWGASSACCMSPHCVEISRSVERSLHPFGDYDVSPTLPPISCWV